MKNILITGSAGFIGYHLALYYLKRGVFVTGVDSFNDYYPVAIKEIRNNELLTYDTYTSLTMDVSDSSKVIDLIKTSDFDGVCHLAAQAGVRYSLENPLSYVTANLSGFANILEGVRHAPSRPRLVYASSSSVYGGCPSLPFTEDARVDSPVSFYAATKKANELMAHTYSHLYDMETTGLRFFTVYGEACRPDMMLWKFTDAIFHNTPIHLYNYGKQRRSFTYVGDIVSGIVSAMSVPKAEKYEVFNLGNDQCEELSNVVSILENAIGRKTEVILKEAQPGDMKETWADITLVKAALGFSPTTSFKECVEIFVKWYLENPEAAQIVHDWYQSAGS